jgi:hypothetical protein
MTLWGVLLPFRKYIDDTYFGIVDSLGLNGVWSGSGVVIVVRGESKTCVDTPWCKWGLGCLRLMNIVKILGMGMDTFNSGLVVATNSGLVVDHAILNLWNKWIGVSADFGIPVLI